MPIGHFGITSCVMDGKQLEFVNIFEYLWRMLRNNSLSKASFMKKESVLNNPHMPMVAKRKAYETFVLTFIFTFTRCRNLKILLCG